MGVESEDIKYGPRSSSMLIFEHNNITTIHFSRQSQELDSQLQQLLQPNHHPTSLSISTSITMPGGMPGFPRDPVTSQPSGIAQAFLTKPQSTVQSRASSQSTGSGRQDSTASPRSSTSSSRSTMSKVCFALALRG